jgi:hypothetical protein
MMIASRCSGRSRSSRVVESRSRSICGATVPCPMGFGRIAAADEAGPAQTDVMIGRSYVLFGVLAQAGLDEYVR